MSADLARLTARILMHRGPIETGALDALVGEKLAEDEERRLTAKQARCLALRRIGLSNARVGELAGIGKGTAEKYLDKCADRGVDNAKGRAA
jgi:hypothetical protein